MADCNYTRYKHYNRLQPHWDPRFDFPCYMRISPVKIRKDKNEGATMTKEISMDQCQDLTQTLTIELPCQMLERIERYAKENVMDAAGVLIEALDSFLRKQD